MLITDAQVHLWRADTPDRPWPDGTHAYAHGALMSADTMIGLMDAAGIHRAVLVPPSWEGDRNDCCAEAVRAHPDRFVAMGRVPLGKPLSAIELKRWCQRYSLRGIRLTFSRGKSHDWLTDGTSDWLWAAAEEAQLPVYIYPPGQSLQIGSIAERHPQLKIALDHLGLDTGLRNDEILAPLEDAISLAKYPNVTVKASSLPSYVTQPYPFEYLHDLLHRVVDAFGPDRVFWGSDVTRLPVPYVECVELFTKAVDFLGEDDLRLIMGEAVATWLGWPHPEDHD